MRDKAIKDIIEIQELEKVILNSKFCHLGMVDGDIPYVLGFCFGYENGMIYLHSLKEGRKREVLDKNNKVCIYFDTDHDLFFRHEQVACSWRLRYRSVLAYGIAEWVDDNDEKVKALNIMMKHYSDKEFQYSQPSVKNISIIRIKIDSMTGRSFEY